MIPRDFPESNTVFGPPADLDKSQCGSIKAFCGQVKAGSLDGAKCVVVAWEPSEDDIAALIAGEPIFVSFIGGLPPHSLSTKFEKDIYAA